MVGCSAMRVVFRHILPNLPSPCDPVQPRVRAQCPGRRRRSHFRHGHQPPATPGAGCATGKNYMFRAWWLVDFSGVAISITVLSINLVASWLRLVSDPQEREKQFARQMRGLRQKRNRRQPQEQRRHDTRR